MVALLMLQNKTLYSAVLQGLPPGMHSVVLFFGIGGR